MKHHNFLLYQVALDELVVQSSSKLGRRALDSDTGGLERGDLGVGITLTTADNGTSVTHSPTWWGGDTSNEADNGLVGGVVLLQEVGSVFLGRTTNLTNHDDAVSLFVLEEDVQAVNEVGTGEGVTTNTNNEGLTKAGLGSLVDGFVGKSSGARDNTNAAALVDESRHDTNLALALVKSEGYPGTCMGREHTGAMIPGQLGPTIRDLLWDLSISVMRTMSTSVSHWIFPDKLDHAYRVGEFPQ